LYELLNIPIVIHRQHSLYEYAFIHKNKNKISAPHFGQSVARANPNEVSWPVLINNIFLESY